MLKLVLLSETSTLVNRTAKKHGLYLITASISDRLQLNTFRVDFWHIVDNVPPMQRISMLSHLFFLFLFFLLLLLPLLLLLLLLLLRLNLADPLYESALVNAVL